MQTIGMRQTHVISNDVNGLNDTLARSVAASLGRPTVHLVAADPTLQPLVHRLLAARDCGLKTFGSAETFLDALRDDGPACLIVEAQLPGLGGLYLQDLLRPRAPCIPLILVADKPAVPAVVRAMRCGAVDFLEKPLAPETLDDALSRALQAATALWEADLQRRMGRERLAMLTPRERQVLEHLLAGRRNKQIASDLVSKEATVKVHRSRLMRKLHVHSLPELLSLILPVMSTDDGEMVRSTRAPRPVAAGLTSGSASVSV